MLRVDEGPRLKTPADIDPGAVPEHGIDVLRAAAAGLIETPPAARMLGWEALDIRPGYVPACHTGRRRRSTTRTALSRAAS